MAVGMELGDQLDELAAGDPGELRRSPKTGLSALEKTTRWYREPMVSSGDSHTGPTGSRAAPGIVVAAVRVCSPPVKVGHGGVIMVTQVLAVSHRCSPGTGAPGRWIPSLRQEATLVIPATLGAQATVLGSGGRESAGGTGHYPQRLITSV